MRSMRLIAAVIIGLGLGKATYAGQTVKYVFSPMCRYCGPQGPDEGMFVTAEHCGV